MSATARAERARAAPLTDVPLQGYACDADRASGPVAPPGGTEFVAAAAELVGEVARAGVSLGERLLRDAFSLIPRS